MITAPYMLCMTSTAPLLPHAMPRAADLGYRNVDNANDIRTPNIDRISGAGVRLGNYYTQAGQPTLFTYPNSIAVHVKCVAIPGSYTL